MYVLEFRDTGRAMAALIKKADETEKARNEAKAWRLIAESLMGVKHK
jgi:hypothetical protein